jgi:hypothetical protein
MKKIRVSFKAGWIDDKDKFDLSDDFIKIIKFFVWTTPCNGTSSSEKKMSTRGWNSNVWKDGKLKDYLVTSADLQQNVYYAIARKLDDMKSLESKINISTKCREHNRVLMYNNGKENDLMQLFYYIRCALAHGRFRIYNDENDITYVMEATGKYRSDYILKARIILKEKTLVDWVDTIISGPDDFKRRIEELKGTSSDLIKQVIRNKPGLSRDKICKSLNIRISEARRIFNQLRDDGIIMYDSKFRSWYVVSNFG